MLPGTLLRERGNGRNGGTMICFYVFGCVPKNSTTDLVLILRGHCSARGTKKASLPLQLSNEEDLSMGSYQPLPLKLPFLSYYGYLREASCPFFQSIGKSDTNRRWKFNSAFGYHVVIPLYITTLCRQ